MGTATKEGVNRKGVDDQCLKKLVWMENFLYENKHLCGVDMAYKWSFFYDPVLLLRHPHVQSGINLILITIEKHETCTHCIPCVQYIQSVFCKKKNIAVPHRRRAALCVHPFKNAISLLRRKINNIFLAPFPS